MLLASVRNITTFLESIVISSYYNACFIRWVFYKSWNQQHEPGLPVLPKWPCTPFVVFGLLAFLRTCPTPPQLKYASRLGRQMHLEREKKKVQGRDTVAKS
jgi:hypothetical protein